MNIDKLAYDEYINFNYEMKFSINIDSFIDNKNNLYLKRFYKKARMKLKIMKLKNILNDTRDSI